MSGLPSTESKTNTNADATALTLIIDAHNHVAENPNTINLIPSLTMRKILVMGSNLVDWLVVEKCATDWPDKVIPSFGIHPWFAHEVTGSKESDSTVKLDSNTDNTATSTIPQSPNPAWKSILLANLAKFPNSIVGEIGLDGVATYPGTKTKYDMQHQEDLFRYQFGLAAELRKPVSIHAVQCFGKLMDMFVEMAKGVKKPLSQKQRRKKKLDQFCEEDDDDDEEVEGARPAPISKVTATDSDPALSKWPPSIMLHSFAGSPDVIARIMRLPKPISTRFYFSFSSTINGRTMDKTIERISLVPDDRILIESDLHSADVVEDACLKACEMVAKAKGWGLEETAIRTSDNAMRFLEANI
ncbi:hypothetical protein HDU76_013076 [Blyttiomyces sp. JEL0837]|nr:hypothetical protein HDU76_013076 [Blyttiomyces sp. JEL0837]